MFTLSVIVDGWYMLAGFKISNSGRLIKKYRALICCGYTVSVYTGMCHLCSQPVKNILTQEKAWNCMILWWGVSQPLQRFKLLSPNPAGITQLQQIFHPHSQSKFTGKSCIHLWRISWGTGKMKREQVKTKVQCLVCSLSMHCVQHRREELSAAACGTAEGQSRSYFRICLLWAPPTPRPGCCNLGNGSAGQRWNIISCESRGSTSAWSCKVFFLTLAIWCKRERYQSSGCWQGALLPVSLSSEEKKKKWLHIGLLQILIFCQKQKHIEILQNTV